MNGQSPGSNDGSSIGLLGGTIVFVTLVILTVVLYAIIPQTDALHAGYAVSMIVFGIALVATAVVIARLGQRATPSDQGPGSFTDR